MKLAHISDLHFDKLGFEFNILTSKRLLGTFNLIFKRRGQHSKLQAEKALDQLEAAGVTHVLITGDFTITGTGKEYKEASQFIEKIKAKGWPIFILPGNHDHYTRKDSKQRTFYRHLEALSPLHEERVAFYDLDDSWRLILLDTSLATKWNLSSGLFSEEMEKKLKALLEESRGKRVIIANHFPFFHHEAPHRRLSRGEALGALIKEYDNVEFYLHGHTHRPTLADLRENGWPVVIDSGSLSHVERGGWNLIDLSKSKWTVSQFLHKQGTWTQSGMIKE
jgi:3',5'-cyclic AMP phosphodiesterase CpdA